MKTFFARLMCMAVAAVLLVPGNAIAAPGEMKIKDISVKHFPEVKITFSTSDVSSEGIPDVQVTENGDPISISDLRSRHEREEIDVVLAMDASRSMRGRPMDAAHAAARDFITALPLGIPVGIVAFADEVQVVQPITFDHTELLAALDSLVPSGYTSLYDGLWTAARMFRGSAQHNIVLLSDGGDSASKRSLPVAVKAARRARSTVYSLGLRTEDTDVAALREISSATEGRYSPAATADLSSLYEGLASRFGNQFTLTYTSEVAAGSSLSIVVEAADGSDQVAVLTPEGRPEAPPVPAVQPREAGTSDGAQTADAAATDNGLAPAPSAPSIVPVLALFFGASFFIVLLLIDSRAVSRRRTELARRISLSPDERAEEPASTESDKRFGSWVPEAFATAGDRIAIASGIGAGLDLKLERASLPIKSGEFIALSFAAGVIGALLLGISLQGPPFAIVGLIIGFFIPRVLLGRAIRRRSQRLHEQLADILMILASSLRSGHSFLQSLDLVAKQVSEPGSEEFGRVVAETRLGRPVNEALLAMAERAASEDLRWAVLAMNVQREVGGNLAEVLDTIAETLREREVVRRQVDVLSAEGRLSAAIMLAMPFIFGLYMAKVSPRNFNLLFSTPAGLSMVGGASALLVVGFFWLRKVVKIDV